MISQQISEAICERLELRAKEYEVEGDISYASAFREAQQVVRDSLRIPEGCGSITAVANWE